MMIWVEVYRDTVDRDFVPAPGKCNYISLLIPKETLLAFLKDRGLTWEYFENESITPDFDGLYEFAKGKIALMKYSD